MRRALFLLLLPGSALAQTTVPSMPLRTFQDSMGINIHMEYTDGNYANEPQVLSDLHYIGISHVRDQIPEASWAYQGLPDEAALMAAGIKFDMTSACQDSESTEMQQLLSLAAAYPGAITSVEGTNEINNQPCPGNGTSAANAIAFQQQLYSDVHSASSLSGVPVLYFTGLTPTATLSGLADASNTHPYPYSEAQPFARVESDFQSLFTGAASAAPQYITETGYADQPTQLNGVDELGQAQMSLNIFFDAAIEGVQRTYLYQLLQAYPNVATNSDTAYGIFHYDGTPTVLARELHNMSLAFPLDAPSSQSNPSVTLQSGSESALPSTVHSLALTTSSGDVIVWAWNEASIWNTGSNSSTIAQPVMAQVALPGTWSSVQLGWPESNILYAWPYAGRLKGQEIAQLPLTSFPIAVVFHK